MSKVIPKYLALTNFSSSIKDFIINYESHPNYPSLYAVTDSLSLIGIENLAAKVSKEQFFEIPITFLSYLNNELVLVERKEDEVLVSNENSKRVSFTFTDFFQVWNGIILVVEENNTQKVFQNSTTKIFTKYSLLLGCLLVVYFLKNHETFQIFSFLGFILSFIGFIIALFIIDEKYGTNKNQITSKICSFSENASCSKVIKTKSALSKWFDFSDLPIIFFVSAIISQLLIVKSLFTISVLCMMSMPLVFYSIWLQKIEIKKWCILCLTISGILLLLAIIGFYIQRDFSFKILLDFFVINSIVLMVWFIIKHNLSNNVLLISENLDLKKFKRNPEIFKSLLKEVSNYATVDSFNKILIGTKDAPIHLTLILSPSCSHCYTVYKEGLEIVKQFEDKISISILFNVNPYNQQNDYLKVVFIMLFINKTEPSRILEALNDWYIERLSLENWLVKWHINNDFKNEKFDLEHQYNWCQENNFNFTPVKLLNDTIYPIQYKVLDLKYFISEIEDISEID